jgi:regulator of CtrA degradation
MSECSNLDPAIVETLYLEALDLAEEARDAFDLAEGFDAAGGGEPGAVQSREMMRTTTRMMHAVAWLINHRAFFAGELTEFQLRRQGRLPPAQPETPAVQLAMLDPKLQDIVRRTRAFYVRIERIDRASRERSAKEPTAVHRLRRQLDHAVAAF